jgi:hypothetical protein
MNFHSGTVSTTLGNYRGRCSMETELAVDEACKNSPSSMESEKNKTKTARTTLDSQRRPLVRVVDAAGTAASVID